MDKKTAIALVKTLAHEARRGWDYLDGLASRKQIEDAQNRIKHDTQQIIQYISRTSPPRKTNDD